MYQIPTLIGREASKPQINAARAMPLPRYTHSNTTDKITLPPHIQKRKPIIPTISNTKIQATIELVSPPEPPTAAIGDYYHYHRLYNHIDLDTPHKMGKINPP